MRVHEYAKLHGLKSKDVLSAAKQIELQLKSASSGVSKEQRAALDAHYYKIDPPSGDAGNGDGGSGTPVEKRQVPKFASLQRPHRYAKVRQLPICDVLNAMTALGITPAARHRELSSDDIAGLEEHFSFIVEE